MIPAPRRAGHNAQPTPITPVDSWPDIDDDEGWQDMPVVRSDKNELDVDDADDDDLRHRRSYAAPMRADPLHAPSSGFAVAGAQSAGIAGASGSGTGGTGGTGGGASGNATGAHLEVEGDTLWSESWRQKNDLDESDYTRLRLDEDEESDAVHMRTKYLFNEDKAMTPLSQMQATKELLTEGQRIAYVGLCHLVGKRMVRDAGRGWEGVKKSKVVSLKGKEKALPPVQDSAAIWMIKIMARLYQHMELEPAEQKMIESLAEHGVDPSDLVPALMTTHTVKNPEFDPNAKKQAELGVVNKEEEGVESHGEQLPPYTPRVEARAEDVPLPPSLSTTPRPPSPDEEEVVSRQSTPKARNASLPTVVPNLPVDQPKRINPFGDDDDEEVMFAPIPRKSATTTRVPLREEDDDGDIGQSLSPVDLAPPSAVRIEDGGDIGSTLPPPFTNDVGANPPSTTTREMVTLDAPDKSPDTQIEKDGDVDEEIPEMLPSLPGVSTSLTNLDEHVTLDIRWTVLCDLFLVLIADSVYDARSRTFLQRVAEDLGFEWLDIVRFENRITDALEIEEAVERSEHGGVIEGRRKAARNKRYAMMGLAAVGGGLVIGLSAGLLAPVIGAGLGAAFATVGVTGTTGFLAGAGGAAVITTGGVLTGANIAGRGMARRTREVRTFEFRPLHNNKKVSCYITMGGFMASKVDDVRLPFSVMDPIVGDVLSIFWEPEMMEETGGALKILTSEVLTSVGQQVLAATLMTALMSALQWPIILTKLGYLIDNPWSNALDRSKAAGLVLADVILNRHAGVRPVSLIGFSLGARAIFYALVELARHKAFGLVQDVFIFGTTVAAPRNTWLDVRSVVAGRLVNGFATNDWMLGYLFRATSGGLATVAGLRPVESVPGMENIEVTEIITGHMSYRSMMPQLMAKAGLPVTSDHFDEPEDPNVDMSVQERMIVNEADEEAKKERSKILGLFPRKQKSGSGTSTPVERKSGEAKKATAASGDYEYDDDDDLPPREDHLQKRDLAGDGEGGDLGMGNKEATASQESIIRQALEAEEKALKAIPKTAGFDFAAISRELGKEINVDKIKIPDARAATAHVDRPGIERSVSVPPAVLVLPPEDEQVTPKASPEISSHVGIGRSSSYDFSTSASGSSATPISPGRSHREEDEDEGDITAGSAGSGGAGFAGLTINPEMPSWDRPASSPTASPVAFSPSSASGVGPTFEAESAGSWRSTSQANLPPASFGYNAWSTPAVSPSANAAMGMGMPRAAPPARPHPPEFMANPFANAGTDKKDKDSGGGGGGGGGGLWGWGKKQKTLEDEAMSNPW